MQITNQSASGLRVRSGSASGPISKWLYRLSAPLRWWKGSSYARAVEELYSLPRRIQATHLLNTSLRGRGYSLPMPVEKIPYLDVLDVCKKDIEELLAENSWMTSLDLEMAAAGWAKGLRFALRTCKETGSASRNP
jgi:hypothetical protein